MKLLRPRAAVIAAIAMIATIAAAAPAVAADLQVKVSQLLPQQGMLRVAVFSRADGFPMQAAADAPQRSLPVTGETMTLVFSGLPEGRYALAVHQDLNGNGQQDFNLLGMPKEPYGASNNKLPALAPPKFDEALFSLGSAGASIEVTLRRP